MVAEIQRRRAEMSAALNGRVPAGEPLTATMLDALEYYGCTSGTSAPPIVRDAIVRATQELRRRRAAEIANEEQVGDVVREALSEAAEVMSEGYECVTPTLDAIADRAAKQLADTAVWLSDEERSILERMRDRAVKNDRAFPDSRYAAELALLDRLLAATVAALPDRKEFDADAHDRGDPASPSDYVDGWNDALDAVGSSVAAVRLLATKSPASSPAGQPQRTAAYWIHLVDLAIRIRDRRFSVRTSLDREDRALFDELSEAVDLYRQTPRSKP